MKIKRLITFFLLVFYLTSNANAAPIDQALKAYKQKEYHKAASVLLKSDTNFDNLSAVNKLKSAIIFWNNAKLNREIGLKAIKTQKIFLESLLTEQEKDKSLFIHLYLSEILIHVNQLELAKKQIAIFLSTQNDAVDPNYNNLANLYLAWIHLKKGDINKFESISQGIKGRHLITDLAIDFIKQREGLQSNISDEIYSDISKNFIVGNISLTSRSGNYALGLLVERNSLSSARAIYNRLPLQAPSHIEEISSIKIINFYESTLPLTLESFFSAFAKHLFESIAKDPKLGDMATFYLSEISIYENNKTTAKAFTKKVKALRRLPKTLNPLKEIRSSTHGFLNGKHTRAYQVWGEAVDNDKNDPVLISDAILMCMTVNGNCPTLVQQAQLAAENSRSKRFESLSTNVGRYFLSKSLNEKALRLMEVALDRSDMNSLLANDPILLLNLAEAYRVNKKYSKSLQVYFSLGQNFPVMRQIQDAVQGEYLFQQRSSGQSNVF